jgi:hypothetical protein
MSDFPVFERLAIVFRGTSVSPAAFFTNRLPAVSRLMKPDSVRPSVVAMFQTW